MIEIEAVKKYLTEVEIWDSLRRAYVEGITKLVNSGNFNTDVALKLIDGVESMYFNAWHSECRVEAVLKKEQKKGEENEAV